MVPRASPGFSLCFGAIAILEDQRRSHSDVVSYQARNTGFKEAAITPASALSGFMGVFVFIYDLYAQELAVAAAGLH